MLSKERIKGFLKKEFLQMFRDVRMRGILFAAPVMMLLIFGYAVNTDVKNVRMAIYDEDKTQQSRALIESFTASGYFVYQASLSSEKEGIPMLDTGKADVYVHIPAGYADHLREGRTTAIQILLDGTDSSRAAVISAQLNAITAGFSKDALQKRIQLAVLSREAGLNKMRKNVEMKERFLFNPDLTSRNFFLPGVLGMLISIITIMLTAMAIVKEREAGTMDQLIVSPIESAELIAGKTLPFVLVGFFDTIVVVVLIYFWFKIPLNGSLLLLLFGAFIYILSTTAVGIFISTISKTQQQALLTMFMYFLPAMMFSGFVFPIFAMPVVVQWISYINPMRYFIDLIRGVFLKGSGIETLWFDIVMLTLLGGFLFFYSARRFSRRMD